MSITVLELDGVEIPMPEGADIAINYKVRDIRNLGFDGSYAESFTLPDTNLTRRAFGNSQFVTSGTKAPYRLLPAKLKQRGNAVLTGYAKHTEVNGGFSVDVDGGNADLFAIVKGKKLSEIDLSDLDHPWTNANTAAANTHNAARGYLYPLINYGQLTDRASHTIGNIHFSELRPAVYVHTLIERMITPYTLTGSLLADLKYRKLVLPVTNEAMKYRESYVAQFATKAVSTNREQYLGFDESGGAINSSLLRLDNVVSDPSGLLDTDGQYVVPQLGDYTIKVSLFIDAAFTGTATTYFYIVLNTADGSTILLHTTGLQPGDNQKIDANLTVEALQPGDTIRFVVFPAYTSTGTYVHAGASAEVGLKNVALPGNPIHLDANMPDVSQEDLLTAVFHMFNVLEQASPVQTVLRLDSLERMKFQQPVDWSRKIDWMQQPVTTFALGEYGQRNFLSYAENEALDDKGNPLTDSIVFEVDNETLEPESEIFVSEFTFTQTLPALKGLTDLPYIPVYQQQPQNADIWHPARFYATGDMTYFQGGYWEALQDNTGMYPIYGNPDDWKKVPRSAAFQAQETKPRLLLLETRATPIYIGDSYDPGNVHPYYVQGTFTGLESATLQAEYHGITEAMLQDTRILTLDMRLNIADINGLDFLRPIMLNIPHKNLQGMFYLNSVNQYMPGKNQSTEVELVRIYGMPLLATDETGNQEFSSEFNSSEFN